MRSNEAKLKDLMKELHPKGTRVKLIHMTDMYQVPDGTEGTVKYVDDAANIHVLWDNGSSLSLIPSEDKWEVLNGS